MIDSSPRFKTWKNIPPGATRAARGILGDYDNHRPSSTSSPIPLSYRIRWRSPDDGWRGGSDRIKLTRPAFEASGCGTTQPFGHEPISGGTVMNSDRRGFLGFSVGMGSLLLGRRFDEGIAGIRDAERQRV